MNITLDTFTKKNIHLPSTLATIGVSTLCGTISGGVIGSAVGLTSALADEYLIHNKSWAKHYFSTATFWAQATLLPAASTLSQFFPEYTLPLYATACAVSGLVMPFFTDDFFDLKTRLEIPLASFSILNQFFEINNPSSFHGAQQIIHAAYTNPGKALQMIQEDLSSLYHNKFLSYAICNTSLILVGVITTSLINQYLNQYASDLFITTLLKASNQSVEELLTKAALVLGTYLARDTFKFFIDSVTTQSLISNSRPLIESCIKLFSKKENCQKILADPRQQEFFQNFASDLFTLLYDGAEQISPIINNYSQILTSLALLQNYSADALAPYIISVLLNQFFLKKLVKTTQETTTQQSKLASKVWNSRFDLIGNLKTINLRDASRFAEYKFCQYIAEEEQLNQKSYLHTHIGRYLDNCIKIFNQCIDVAHFGTKIFTGILKLEQVYPIQQVIDSLLTAFSANLNFQKDKARILISNERIGYLLKLIAQDTERSLKQSFNTEGKVTIKDYTLFNNGDQLIKIDSFEFMPGKRYAIMGPSGCGKSSMLMDWKEGLDKPFQSHGEIFIPACDAEHSSVMYIDQKLYIPADSTLLEILYFPNVIADLNCEQVASLKTQVLQLMDELEIDSQKDDSAQEFLKDKLDSKAFGLSGGQAKKVAIIQAILNQPKVLLSDEGLVGLDERSLKIAQDVLKKYLPHTLMITVDHHAMTNNQHDFYDSILAFTTNGLIEVK